MSRSTIPHRPVLVSVALGLLAIGVLASVTAGAVALFSDRTTNPGTGIATGTLQMSNTKENAALFSASGLRPGQQTQGTVTVANTGTLSATYALSVTEITRGGSGTGNLSTLLTVSITDELGRVAYSGPLASMPSTALPGAAGLSWARAETHTYTFVASVPASADNTYQDTSVTATYVWDASQ